MEKNQVRGVFKWNLSLIHKKFNQKYNDKIITTTVEALMPLFHQLMYTLRIEFLRLLVKELFHGILNFWVGHKMPVF